MAVMRRLSMILPVASVLLIVIFYKLGQGISSAPRLYTVALATVFSGLLPCIVAFLAVREFLLSCRISFLLVGFGIFIYAAGAAAGSWLFFTPGGLNNSETVQFSGALSSAVFQLVAAMWVNKDDYFVAVRTRRLVTAVFGGAVFVFFLFLVFSMISNLEPRFFNGTAPTAIRQATLFFSALGYFAAAMIFLKLYRSSRYKQQYWYALFLLLIAVSSFAKLNEKTPGDPAYWISFADMLLGGIFAGIALLPGRRSSRRGGMLKNDLISYFFTDAVTYYRDLVETSGDAILSVDQEFRVFLANSAAKQLFGFQLDSSSESFLDRCIIGHYKGMITKDFSDYIRKGASSLSGAVTRMEARDSSGRLFPIEITVSIRKHHTGYMSTYTIRDITERKKAEAQILALVEHLQQADKSKERFISTMSHELRNPLATITAGLKLLELLSEDSKIKEIVHDLGHEAGFIGSLVSDLLDATRLSHNKLELKIQHVDIGHIALSAAEGKKTLFDAKGIRLDTDLPEGDVYADADPTRIKQAVDNLLYNALNFSDTGGSAVLSVIDGATEISIHVRDTGIGIRPEFIPDLFEPYKQADSTFVRNNGGLGLGLSIVKGIAELHGGKVSAHSEGPGKGSEFAIYLPKQCPLR